MEFSNASGQDQVGTQPLQRSGSPGENHEVIHIGAASRCQLTRTQALRAARNFLGPGVTASTVGCQFFRNGLVELAYGHSWEEALGRLKWFWQPAFWRTDE